MRRTASGFTLIEVVIALLLVAIWLTVVLDTQASSLRKTSRARDVTIASMLARSKMVDVEQIVFDEGFVDGPQEESGDFGDEGHKNFKWTYRLIPVEMDLSSLSSLCDGFAGASEADEGADVSCDGMFSSLGGPLDLLMDEIGRSIRLVELIVSWAEGKYTQTVRLTTLLTQEDFQLAAP